MPGFLLGLLALGHCMAFADRSLPAVAAPLLKASLGLSDTQLGLLDGPAFVALYVVGMLASWPMARSRHRLYLAAGCIGSWVAGMLLFAVGTDIGVLVAGRALMGLGQAAYIPLALGLIVEQAAPVQRGRTMAVFTAASVVGRGAALLAGGALLAMLVRWAPAMAHTHWRLLFLLMTGPNLVLMLLLLTYREPPQWAPSAPAKHFAGILATVRERPGLVAAYLCVAAASVLVTQTLGAWAPSVLQREHGLAPGTAAFTFGAALLVASPLGHFLAGTLVDRRSPRLTPLAIAAGALALVAPLMRLLPEASSAFAACGLLALASLAGGTAAVAALAGLPQMLAGPARDAGLRLFLAFVTVVGAGLGPLMAGVVSDQLGSGGSGLSEALFDVCAAAGALGIAAAAVASRSWRRAAAEVAG
jgi:MFS family permease